MYNLYKDGIYMNSLRNEVFSYIKKKYDAEPEYLWHRYPGYAVFRHADNDKWFCIIMDQC